MRTDRASDTLDFFQGEVERLSAALAEQSKKIADFKTANVAALPDSMDSRRAQQEREEQRLLDLQREEAALKNQRATWSGSSSAPAAPPASPLSPEEEELQKLQSQLLQQQAIYKAGSPQIRVLQTRIAALQSLVAEQQAARAVPGADGQPAQPLTELEVELAPIDEQLKYIADERAGIEQTLADLAASLQATPENEMTLAELEREFANLQTQYDNAVAALGQAQVTEKIEVLSKGQRFTLIEAPIEKDTPVSPPRLLIASAGIVGGLGAAAGFIVLWEMLNRSIRRPVELIERPRHPADRHHPLHADGGRAAAQARAGPRHPRADRDRHPVRALRHPHPLHAARPAARRRDRLGRARGDRRDADDGPAGSSIGIRSRRAGSGKRAGWNGFRQRSRRPRSSAVRWTRRRPAAASASARGPQRPSQVGPAWAELAAFEPEPRLLARNHIVTFEDVDPAHSHFDILRTKVLRTMQRGGWTSLGITSPTSGCGKTTLALNLAFSLAHQPDMRTVLVELDLRRPSMARQIGLKAPQSMAGVLQGTRGVVESFVRYGDNLAIGTNAQSVRDSAELLMNARDRRGRRRDQARLPARRHRLRPAADAAERRRHGLPAAARLRAPRRRRREEPARRGRQVREGPRRPDQRPRRGAEQLPLHERGVRLLSPRPPAGAGGPWMDPRGRRGRRLRFGVTGWRVRPTG